MGIISTHVLDVSRGKPAQGCSVELWYLGSQGHNKSKAVVSTVTNQNGRTDDSLLENKLLPTGVYELVFFVEEYFQNQAMDCFWEKVSVRFKVVDPESSYHVPLLISPWGYSTYRGS